MQKLEVIIESCGTKAKEINPHGCYGGNKPHPMDFDNKEEFQLRLTDFIEAESKLKVFEIENGKFTANKKYSAEILKTGKIQII